MVKLTKRFIDDLTSDATDHFEWDDDIPGFGIRVWPSGRKVFVAQYRAGHRSRRLKIGNYGTLTLEEARKEARGILGDVARGGDPQQDRVTKRQSMTVRQLCEAYLKAADKGLIMGKRSRPKKTSTLATDRGRIDRHILPLMGGRLVKELRTADIQRFVRDVQSGRTAAVVKTDRLRGKAVVEGGAGTAARTTGLLGGILSFAVSEGVIEFNPARGVKRPAGKSRDRRLDAIEFRALGDAIAAVESEGEAWQAIAGARLLALTGCRLSEVAGLEWSEVDAKAGCFRFSDTKEDASVRPIGRPAFNVIAELRRDDGERYVLPAVRKEKASYSVIGAFERIVKRAGLVGVTPHTLRHSYGSVAGDLGYSETTIGNLLGHAKGSVTSRYVHHLDSVLIAAADKVARTIEGYMTGDEATTVI